MKNLLQNEAIISSNEAYEKVVECINRNRSFLVEAGAGAGKTYSLVRVLNYIIKTKANGFKRLNQKVGCITYTNAAKNEIIRRTSNHPIILTETIHSFCWDLLKNFQPILKNALLSFEKWQERLVDIEDITHYKVCYDLGIPYIADSNIYLHHNDILKLMTMLLPYSKFQNILQSRYPVILIDEYQDTNKDFASNLKHFFIDNNKSLLLGFFGDPWQKIYGDGCGEINDNNLTRIQLKSNFRSVKTIVESLNKIRPTLPQSVADNTIEGEVYIFHTNTWKGTRRTGAHWKGDLPVDEAHQVLLKAKYFLKERGWDFSPRKLKILMLTHNILASEIGYKTLLDAYSNRRDELIKAEDPYINFFIRNIEPACLAYKEKNYANMLLYLGGGSLPVYNQKDKQNFKTFMDGLVETRIHRSIKDVIDFINNDRPSIIPEKISYFQSRLPGVNDQPETDDKYIKIALSIQNIPYMEVINLASYIEENTPFSTKHGVKGEEYENVIITFGRGWNLYNFSEFLDLSSHLPLSEKDIEKYERNRNLFYVACSRPRKRLALVFTQELSDNAFSTLEKWFGKDKIMSLEI